MEIWKKQKKILIAFGIFMAFMLLCTLVSRVIYASKLPQVTVDSPRRLAINHNVDAEGIVHQGREYAINVLSGLRVRTVYVHIGDRVTTDTLLFDLDVEDLKEKIQEQELAIKKLQLQIATLEQNRSLDNQKKATDSARAQEDYARAESEAERNVERALEDLDNAEDALDDHKDHPFKKTSQAERDAQQAAYDDWVKKEEELNTALQQAKEEYETAQAEVKRLEEASANAAENENDRTENSAGSGEGSEEGSPSESDNSADSSENTNTNEVLEAARQAEAAAKEKCEALEVEYQKHIDNPVAKPDFSSEDAEEESWREKRDSLEDAVDAAERAVDDAEQSRSDALLEAGRKVTDANIADNADSSLEISKLELTAMQTELESFQKILDSGGQVYPEVEGIITRIQVSAGERVPDGAAVVYADLSSPMQFNVSLTKEQKKYVNQGDTIELTLGGSAKQEATIDYVAENEANPELYDVYIFLPDGVGTIGQSGELHAETQSETFSCCIPLEALREDANHRKYVYIVSEKSGILGKELAAEAVYVKVLDQNDTYAAIEGGVIDQETELILTSTEALEDRDVIRYKE